MKLYSLLDKKAGMYGAVMMAMNDGHMSRFLQERFVDPQETVKRFPDDFDLYEVGEFSQDTGECGSPGVPRFVVNMAVILNGGGHA